MHVIGKNGSLLVIDHIRLQIITWRLFDAPFSAALHNKYFEQYDESHTTWRDLHLCAKKFSKNTFTSDDEYSNEATNWTYFELNMKI